jgi:hypothetical protein
MTNAERARAWVETYFGVLVRDDVRKTATDMIAAAVRAKGEMDAQGIRGMADVSNGLVHAGHRHALTWLRAHAADVPEVPKGVIGRAVYCVSCGLRKAPRGRSVPLALANSLCDMECPGWVLPPHPGDLWPGESAEEFGYPCQGEVPRA